VIRVAAVDLGTNSTRLLVADVEDGCVEEVERRLRITRLGEGVDRRRLLLPTAIARVRNCLVEYRRAAESLGAERILAVATSAVRDAENGEAFLGEIEWSYGFSTRLLDGDEEALLTFRGVAAGREVAEGTLVVDIGGGSTELILGGAEGVEFHRSLDIGCVRLTERFGDDVEACATHVRATLPELDVRGGIGVAGTVTHWCRLQRPRPAALAEGRAGRVCVVPMIPFGVVTSTNPAASAASSLPITSPTSERSTVG